jgi:hypothetical protein
VADNLNVTPGTGATIGTKDVSGVHHPKALVEANNAAGTPAPLQAGASADGRASLLVTERSEVWDFAFAALGGTDTYAAGEVVSGVETQDNSSVYGSHGALRIDHVNVLDCTDTGPDLDIYLFGDVTAGTATPGATWAPTDTDLNNLFIDWSAVRVEVRSANWKDLGGAKVAQIDVGRYLTGWFGIFSILVIAQGAYTTSADGDLQAHIVARTV